MSDIDDVNLQKTLEETDEKCPQCAATISYDPAAGLLKCPYCGFTKQVVIDGKADDKAEELVFADARNAETNFQWGAAKKTVICENCGGESVYDALMVSDVCPYCGSNQVTEAKAGNSIPPNGVIPFCIAKEDATQRFQSWLKKRWYAPSKAKKTAKEGKLTGLFLPYWTFDAKTYTDYTAQAGYTRTVTTGKTTHTVTTWKRVSGFYFKQVDDFLVSASTHHDAALMKKIEPFDTNNAKRYDPEFLAGFISERYSVGLRQGWENAKVGIDNVLKNEITAKIKREKHADKVASLKTTTTYDGITYKHLMLPMWVSNFAYKGKVYNSYVNGQTGKVGGRYPISAFRVMLTIVIVLAIVLLIYWLYQNGGGGSGVYYN
ncbi:MAG TPA: hypothetical protein PLT14_05815 [Oscillospiraceae bacterium]|nr:hypothetical protein [Oscillospiraceae bacterium]